MVTRYIHCDLHVSLHSAYTVIYTHGYMVHALWFTRVVTQNIHCDLHAWLPGTYTVIYTRGYPVHTLKWEDLMVTRYIHCDLHSWLHGTCTVIYMLGYTVHTLWFTHIVTWYIHCDLHGAYTWMRRYEATPRLYFYADKREDFRRLMLCGELCHCLWVWPLSVSVCFLCLVSSSRLLSLAERLLFIIPFFSVRYWKW